LSRIPPQKPGLLGQARLEQPVVKVWLHSTGEASPPAALLLAQILPVSSVVAPCRRGASAVSVRRQTFTTGCSAPHSPTKGAAEATAGRDGLAPASIHRPNTHG